MTRGVVCQKRRCESVGPALGTRYRACDSHVQLMATCGRQWLPVCRWYIHGAEQCLSDIGLITRNNSSITIVVVIRGVLVAEVLRASGGSYPHQLRDARFVYHSGHSPSLHFYPSHFSTNTLLPFTHTKFTAPPWQRSGSRRRLQCRKQTFGERERSIL
jgi:hypothetical protein